MRCRISAIRVECQHRRGIRKRTGRQIHGDRSRLESVVKTVKIVDDEVEIPLPVYLRGARRRVDRKARSSMCGELSCGGRYRESTGSVDVQIQRAGCSE